MTNGISYSHYDMKLFWCMLSNKEKWKSLYIAMQFSAVREVLIQLYGNFQTCFCCYIVLNTIQCNTATYITTSFAQ